MLTYYTKFKREASFAATDGLLVGLSINVKNCSLSIMLSATNHKPQKSRVCAVAQYSVLEANAKVNWRGQFSHPHPFETPQPISMSCQIYYYVPQWSWRAKFGLNRFGRYGSAHAWKNTVCVDFLLTYLSVCLSVSSSGLQVTVLGRF